MIKMNPLVKLIIGTVLAGLIPAGQYFVGHASAGMGAAGWVSSLVAAFVYADAYFTKPHTMSADAKAAAVKAVGSIFLVLPFTVFMAVIFAMPLTGCPQAVPAVQPIVSCVSAVVADALAGMTVDQIVKKEGASCVADAAEVVTILMGNVQKFPQLKSTVAYGEALKLLPPADAGAQ